MRKIEYAILISALAVAVGCGGGAGGGNSSPTPSTPTSTPTPTPVIATPTTTVTSTAGGNTIAAPAPNVAPLLVDAGPAAATTSQVNVAFTKVTLCAPSAPTSCVTLDHIAVDTGSTGLRIPVTAFHAFANGATVLAALQNVNPGAPVASCVHLGNSSYLWGSVKLANIKMGGTSGDGTGSDSEVATSLPIQVMGDSSIPSGSSIPGDCALAGEPNEGTVAALGANGLLGVGNYQYDCDVPGLPTGPGSSTTFGIGSSNACASSSTPPPGAYYTCSASSCSASLVPASQQLQNPVSKFATDNNGVIIELPSVATGVGGKDVVGSMVFGIGTQSNNALDSRAVVMALDTDNSHNAWLGFSTVFNNVTYPDPISYTGLRGNIIDSGAIDIFFLNQATSGINVCGTGQSAHYCPASTQNLMAGNQASGSNIRSQVPFFVSDPSTLPAGTTAFSDLGAPDTSGLQNFVWGLPFFYGRNVYTSIWGVTPPTGVPAGPFWAY